MAHELAYVNGKLVRVAEATVSVWTFGAASPTSGMSSFWGVTTLTCDGAASIPPPACVTVSTDQLPGLENFTSAP